jgi:uncharacterized protein (TIGR02246 family)
LITRLARRSAITCALGGAALIAAAAEPVRSPRDVVRHHIEAMLAHDAAALVDDYADDAVMVLSSGVFSGKEQIRQLFARGATRRTAPTDDQAVFTITRVDGDVVIEEWSRRAADGATLRGTDVLVVHAGRIVFHATQPAAQVPAPAPAQR